MLNEFTAISSSGGALPGIGRNQALKDGAFAGPCPFTDSQVPPQKDFLSILSRLGSGILQAAPEVSIDPSPKPADGRLPDGMKADAAVSEKPKGKQAKKGCDERRLPSGCPETPGLMTGLLAPAAPPQPDPSITPEIQAPNAGKPDSGNIDAGKPDSGNIDETASARIAGELSQEKTMKTGLQWEPGSPSGKLLKVCAPADSVQGPAVPAAGSAKASMDAKQRHEPTQIPEIAPSLAEQKVLTADARMTGLFQKNPLSDAKTAAEMEMTPNADPSSKGQVRDVPAGGSATEPKNSEQPPDLPQAPEPLLSVAGQVGTNDVRPLELFPGRPQFVSQTGTESDMVAKSAPEKVLSGTWEARKVDIQGMPDLQRLQKTEYLAVQTQAALEAAPAINNPGVKGGQLKRLSSDKIMDGVAREKTPMNQMDGPGLRNQTVRVKTASVLSSADATQTGATAAVSSGASNAGDNEKQNMFMAAGPPVKIAGGKADASFQIPEPESGEMTVNFSSQGHMEKIFLANPSKNDVRTEDSPFHAEVLKQVVEKTSIDMKSGQSEIRIDLKPESLGHLRLHVSMEQQQVTVKILAENTRVKEMIENQSSLIKNELQQQGIHVHTVKVDMLMSGGSDFAYSQHEGAAFKQARHESAYGGGKDNSGGTAPNEPESMDQTGGNGGSLVNYFA